MLLKDLEWVIKTFRFDLCQKTKVGYSDRSLAVYNDQVQVEIFTVYDIKGTPRDRIRVFEDVPKPYYYSTYDLKEFMANPDRILIDKIVKKQRLNEV